MLYTLYFSVAVINRHDQKKLVERTMYLRTWFQRDQDPSQQGTEAVGSRQLTWWQEALKAHTSISIREAEKAACPCIALSTE